nr:hypothetical protein [Kibdelosporangium sp. MJ126-NF4]
MLRSAFVAAVAAVAIAPLTTVTASAAPVAPVAPCDSDGISVKFGNAYYDTDLWEGYIQIIPTTATCTIPKGSVLTGFQFYDANAKPLATDAFRSQTEDPQDEVTISPGRPARFWMTWFDESENVHPAALEFTLPNSAKASKLSWPSKHPVKRGRLILENVEYY